ncbi:MAG: IPT/TIG domain-containing protein, partial [Gammaproteobacteria bacterium]|nr:IPT/TIG domain-containing protein [Gammaproteobacteria bacterium]
ALPDNLAALGIDGYFERGYDRIFVSAARFDADGQPEAGSAQLLVYAIDSDDISRLTLVKTLALGARFAKGLLAENYAVTLAAAEQGLALADAYLHNKLYLAQHAVLPAQHSALDVAAMWPDNTQRYTLVAAGDYDFSARALRSSASNSGGVYLFAHDAERGLQLVSSVNLPGSRVVVQGQLAVVAAGDAGALIIDYANPREPVVLARLAEYGHVYDIALNGSLLYLALGESGIKAFDISNAKAPKVLPGLVSEGADIRLLTANSYSVLAAGSWAEGSRHRILSFNDVALTIIGLSPLSRLLGADDIIRLRFNKAIDLWPDNLSKFVVTDEQGQRIAAQTSIVNNDAEIRLTATNLQSGQLLNVTAQAGVKSVKPLTGNRYLTLYELSQPQQFQLRYAGAQLEALELQDVLPRRAEVGVATAMTLTVVGWPQRYDTPQIRVGGVLAEQVSVQRSEQNERLALLHFTLPPISQPGLYDLELSVPVQGVLLSGRMQGAVVVDAALSATAVLPLWTDVKGGDWIDLYGSGFEPGNSVQQGTSVTVGAVKASGVQVLSSNWLRFVAPRNPSGRHRITVTNRTAGQRIADDALTLGYGMAQLSGVAMANTSPQKVLLDASRGLAFADGGYFAQGYSNETFNGYTLPDKVLAMSVDINNRYQPLLVGGVPSINFSKAEQEQFAKDLLKMALLRKQLLGDPLTEQEEAMLAEGITPRAYSFDALSLQQYQQPLADADERRNSVVVATGNGGVYQLGTDEANGMPILMRELLPRRGGQPLTSAVAARDYAVYAAGLTPGSANTKIPECSNVTVPAERAGLSLLSMLDSADPVLLAEQLALPGSHSLYLADDGWLYAGGLYQALQWQPAAGCELLDFNTIAPGIDNAGQLHQVLGINLFDPLLRR